MVDGDSAFWILAINKINSRQAVTGKHTVSALSFSEVKGSQGWKKGFQDPVVIPFHFEKPVSFPRPVKGHSRIWGTRSTPSHPQRPLLGLPSLPGAPGSLCANGDLISEETGAALSLLAQHSLPPPLTAGLGQPQTLPRRLEPSLPPLLLLPRPRWLHSFTAVSGQLNRVWVPWAGWSPR